MEPEDQVDDPVEDEVEDPSGTPPEAAEDDDDDADGAETTSTEGDEPPEPGTKAWADLQKKYPGMDDEAIKLKVSADYWDQTRALSRASKENRDLQIRLARAEGRLEGSGPPPEKEPAAPPPEVQELDSHITGLRARDEQVSNDQIAKLAELNEAREKVGELKGELKAAKEAGNEDKADRLETRVEVAEAKVARVRGELQTTIDKRKDIAFQIGRMEKEREWLTSVAAQAKANEDQERTETEEQLAAAPKLVDGFITEAIVASGVPADPAFRAYMRETLREKVTIDLWKFGKKVPFNKIDVPGLLKQHTARFLKAHEITKRADFKEKSAERTRTATPPTAAKDTPTGPPAKKVTVVSGRGALSEGMLRGRRILSKSGW